MPASVISALEARVRASAIRILQYRAELLHLATALEPEGIPLLVLKGMHLATSAYPSPAMREMNDIDVLVHEAHLDRVASVARSLGFSPMSETSREAAARVRHHLPRFLKPGVGLEIHWRLAPQGQAPVVESNELWKRAQASAIAPHVVQLCPEDAVLHISAHATISHFLELGIRPLCDIRALADKSGDTMDWEAVASRAGAWQCERGLLLALELSRRLLKTDIPELVFDRLRHARPTEEMLRIAASMIFEAPTTDITESVGRLMAFSSLSGRVRYAWSRVRMSPDQLAVRYPGADRRGRAFRALLPAHRLLDLTHKYGVNLTRLAMNPQSERRKIVDRRNTLAAWLRDE